MSDVRVDPALVEGVVRSLLAAARHLDPTALVALPTATGLRGLSAGEELCQVHDEVRARSVDSAGAWARTAGARAMALKGSVRDLEDGEEQARRQFRGAPRTVRGNGL